jgi:precorrin-3B methylase
MFCSLRHVARSGVRKNLQTLEAVPDADIVVMHKLMIEADEETYLQTANTFTPRRSGDWDV